MATAAGLVVVGGSIAGVRAVEGTRAAGHTGTITLHTAEQHLPYDRPPLSKDLLAPHGTIDPPTLRDEAGLGRARGGGPDRRHGQRARPGRQGGTPRPAMWRTPRW